MRRSLGIALVLAALSATGCRGILYTNITEPLDVNLDNTPVFQRGRQGDTKEIRYYVGINWDSNGIGDVAKKNGLTEVHYADMTTMSVLGIWTQRIVTVYGK